MTVSETCISVDRKVSFEKVLFQAELHRSNKILYFLWLINDEWEGCGHGLYLRHYPSSSLEGWRRTMIDLRQDSPSLNEDLNPGTPEY